MTVSSNKHSMFTVTTDGTIRKNYIPAVSRIDMIGGLTKRRHRFDTDTVARL